jgi:hypothetical protein
MRYTWGRGGERGDGDGEGEAMKEAMMVGSGDGPEGMEDWGNGGTEDWAGGLGTGGHHNLLRYKIYNLIYRKCKLGIVEMNFMKFFNEGDVKDIKG